MVKWNTINKGLNYSSTKDTVEIQVERLSEDYQVALKLHQEGQQEAAKQKYEELVSHTLFKPKPEQDIGTNTQEVEQSPLSTLRFLVFKNYALFLADEFFNTQDKTTADTALQYYLQAVEIDHIDYSLWYHVGYLAHTIKRRRLARLAFETGLNVTNEQRALTLHVAQPDQVREIVKAGKYTPMQWKCLEGLVKVLYDIADYTLCQQYIDIIKIRIPDWHVGLDLESKMNTNVVEWNDEDTVMEEAVVAPQTIDIVLEKSDWPTLLVSLLKNYKLIEKKYQDNFSIETIVNKAIHIVLEKNEEQEEQGIPAEGPATEAIMQDVSSQDQASISAIASQTTTTKPINNDALDVAPTSNITVIEDDDVDVPIREESPTSPTKRKRQDEVGDDHHEEDDEDEAEEKRLSLRASKRQRDKIEIEEKSRTKMLVEEEEFTQKVQDYYDKLKHLPKLYRQTPWYDVATKPFWKWFDKKISELDHTKSWDVEKEAKSNAFGDTKGNTATLFTTSSIEQENTQITDTVTVKAFIIELNKINSGITDSLCRLILKIVEHDSVIKDDTTPVITMSNEFLDLITETITILGSNILECILSYSSLAQKLLIITRINEYLSDRLIRETMEAEKDKSIHITRASKKKFSTSLAKAHQLELISNLNAHCLFWMDKLDVALFDISLEKLCPSIFRQDGEMDTSTDDEKTEIRVAQLRYWILKGKLAQCNDDIQEAHVWYSRCREKIEATTITINCKSMYDSIIDLAHLTAKLDLLRVGKLFITAKQKLAQRNFQGVIEDLEPIVHNQSNKETIQILEILAKAYVETDRKLDAWNCYTHMFCYAVNKLVHGESKEQDQIEFFKLLSLLNYVTNHMLLLIEAPSLKGWLPRDINEDLQDRLWIVLRMTIYYIFRHPDFVPLVNNFTNDLPPHKPAKSTKQNGFNDLMVQAWVLQTRLLQHAIQDDKSQVMTSWVEVFQRLHDELGEREVCGAAKGALLQTLMKTLVSVDDKRYRNDIYQCYHCLYGQHLAAETDVIEEHHCIHTNLDQKAAEPLFALVVDAAIEKLHHGTILKTDLKDVIDTVSGLFVDLPLNHALVKTNQILIDDYLKSDLVLYPSLDNMLRNTILPTHWIDSVKTKILSVYYKMFWIRGKTLRILIKNRAKANNEKTMADLETAIDEFTNHLILSPEDADGWSELAACYQLLSEEELSWSAYNIKSRRETIAEYQRKSCHAYLRSIHLLKQDNAATKIMNELFMNFGHLVYAMASRPMQMEAFSFKKRIVMAKDGSLMEIQEKPPSTALAYKLAFVMYHQALVYKVHDELEWRCYYMIGKCCSKIGRPPKEVLDWFLKAIHSTRSKKAHTTTSKNAEPILEPIYIFYSYLAKYLYEGKIQAQDVEEFLARGKVVHDRVEVVSGTSCMEQIITTHLSLETSRAYNGIFERLKEIRAVDKKNTHHRPLYRIAWMYHYVYHNTDAAKTELMKLFPLKVVTKTYIHIWISGFELPGKHFEYHHKYTLFLIQLAKESNDVLTLKYLYKKLRKAPNLLLEDKQVFQMAYHAYLELIRLTIRSIHHAKTYMKMIKESKMSVDDFQSLCKTSSKHIFQDKSIADPELYSILVDLADLSKLIQGFILGGLDDEELNKVVRMTYAAMILGGEANEEKQQQLQMAALTDEDEASLSKTRKDLRVVLLAEAKLFMQSVLVISK